MTASPLAETNSLSVVLMKLTIVAIEIPYPPSHGGRVDIWRHIEAFAKLDLEMQLICWSPDEVSVADQNAIEELVSDLHVLKYASPMRRCLSLHKYPVRNTSRMLFGDELETMYSDVEQFQPDVILIEGLSGCILGQQLSAKLDVPYVYRSQNIEHQHQMALWKVTTGRQKVSSFPKLMHLERLERKTIKESAAFFDISTDDIKYWESQGFDNGYFLPPLLDINSPIDPASSTGSNQYDVVFLGNLFTENNVAGIEWFLRSVVPLILREKPDLSVLIAGSNPLQSVIDLCNEIDCVELLISPESAEETFHSGAVLVNPIAVGGGVSIKTIDMLVSLRPIVTLKKGIYGIDDSVKCLFHLADDEQSFAAQVLHCLENPLDEDERINRKHLVEAAFGIACMEKMVEQLHSVIEQPQQQPATV